MLFLAGLILAALLAPLLVPYAADALDLAHRRAAPSLVHWFGTDELGRDVLSRLIWGSRLVLVWATLATTVAYAAGMIMGVVGGYRGGWWDEIISFFGNVLLSFPLMVLYIVIISRFGPASEFGQYLSRDLGFDPVLTSGVIIIVAVTFGYTDVPVHALSPDAVIDHYRDLEAAIERVLRR